jgi:ankyrin repeat protein
MNWRFIVSIIVTIILSSLAAEIFRFNYNKPSKIFELVYQGDLSALQQHLNNSAHSIDIRDAHNNTLLHWIAKSNAPAAPNLLELALNSGANVNAVNNAGTSVLHWATYSDNPQVLERLITSDANIFRRNLVGETPLHWAVDWQRLNAAKTLLKHYDLLKIEGNSAQNHDSVDINSVDQHGNSAFHKVAVDCDQRQNCIALVKVLLESGANPLLKNNYQRTPLQHFNSGVDSYINQYMQKLKAQQAADEEAEAKLSQAPASHIEAELKEFKQKLESEYHVV